MGKICIKFTIAFVLPEFYFRLISCVYVNNRTI